MLDAYKRLQANGVIGTMMKVGSDGKPILDPGGELPGQLIPRPFVEYPKAIRRVRTDAEGNEKVVEYVVHSKAEELRLISDSAMDEEPRSPLEKERDSLAEDLNTERKMNAELAKRLENLAAEVERLKDVPKVPPVQAANKKGLTSLGGSAEAKAVQNIK